MWNWTKLDWSYLGTIAVLVLVTIGAFAVAAPVLLMRKRRRAFLHRVDIPILELQRGARGDRSDAFEITQAVIAAAKETIGVPAEKLRLEDDFCEEYGWLKGIVGQDAQQHFLDLLSRNLHEKAGLQVCSEKKTLVGLTLGKLVHELLLCNLRCAKCDYDLRGVSTCRCPECGVTLGFRE